MGRFVSSPVFDPNWLTEKRLEVARYAFDGETVFVPVLWPDGVWHLVAARVVCAAGNHARMVNENRLLDRWFDVNNIYRRRADL